MIASYCIHRPKQKHEVQRCEVKAELSHVGSGKVLSKLIMGCCSM